MSFKEKLEEKINQTERKLNEFSIRLKKLDQELKQILNELELTPEQLKNYVQDPDRFTPPVWEQLQAEKKKWDEKINLEINSLSDPLKTKKTISERGNVQQHWLFVR